MHRDHKHHESNVNRLVGVCSLLQAVCLCVKSIFGSSAGSIVTVYRSSSSTATYDPLDIAVALNFTSRAAAGGSPPPPSVSAPTGAVSGTQLLTRLHSLTHSLTEHLPVCAIQNAVFYAEHAVTAAAQ